MMLKVMGRRIAEMAITKKPFFTMRKSSFRKRKEMDTGTTARYMIMSPSASVFTDFRKGMGQYSC